MVRELRETADPQTTVDYRRRFMHSFGGRRVETRQAQNTDMLSFFGNHKWR